MDIVKIFVDSSEVDLSGLVKEQPETFKKIVEKVNKKLNGIKKGETREVEVTEFGKPYEQDVPGVGIHYNIQETVIAAYKAAGCSKVEYSSEGGSQISQTLKFIFKVRK